MTGNEIDKKLFKIKTFKLNGVRFSIRKLGPSQFLDRDYLFPMSTVTEKLDPAGKEYSARESQKVLDEFKEKMRDVVLRGVVSVKSRLFSKKKNIEDYIDSIVETPDMLSYLFTLVANHSLGVKKNYSHLFQLTGITPKLST